MTTSGCKQVTLADIKSGWNFSGPLADQIRRKKGTPAAIAQSGEDAPTFGASTRAFEGLRFRGSWKLRHLQGWSAKAIVTWYLAVVQETRKEHEGWAIGCPKWWEDHQP